MAKKKDEIVEIGGDIRLLGIGTYVDVDEVKFTVSEEGLYVEALAVTKTHVVMAGNKPENVEKIYTVSADLVKKIVKIKPERGEINRTKGKLVAYGVRSKVAVPIAEAEDDTLLELSVSDDKIVAYVWGVDGSAFLKLFNEVYDKSVTEIKMEIEKENTLNGEEVKITLSAVDDMAEVSGFMYSEWNERNKLDKKVVYQYPAKALKKFLSGAKPVFLDVAVYEGGLLKIVTEEGVTAYFAPYFSE